MNEGEPARARPRRLEQPEQQDHADTIRCARLAGFEAEQRTHVRPPFSSA